MLGIGTSRPVQLDTSAELYRAVGPSRREYFRSGGGWFAVPGDVPQTSAHGNEGTQEK